MKFCPQCGEAQNDNVSFCSKCGASMPQASAQNVNNAQWADDFAHGQAATYNGSMNVNQGPVYNTQQTQNAASGYSYANQQSNFVNSMPLAQLSTDRSLIKFFLLSLITCGIYSIIYYSSVSSDINIIASRYDGKKTMHYCLMFFLISPLTFGIGTLVWFHNISSRIGSELTRRGINYDFGAGTFWLWNVLGAFIIVGPFVYVHKLSEAMNLLATDFNQRG